ncbi:MAG: phosphoribulokinase [endosymbiont of Galathealinum brachiosum]|uniref:phosphoribulokinase n=1 Tax=endosymbiont of Galathealinum brachiosum TaxID=2200906 RepID=A0A370DDM4_9GAMM|nr:MAG: phosphoribulokinase [endosymbiont of Galathealinum brachiosum]
MSEQYPIIAVTGASGAGTTVVQQAFKEIFFRQKINAAFIQGDGFLRYNDVESEKHISRSLADGRHISCYGPDLNDFSKLQDCFSRYSKTGRCDMRFKVTEENQHLYNASVGEFTEWQQSPADADCLFYEGMHGGVVAETWTRRKSENTDAVIRDRRSANTNGVNAAQYVDLLIGVAPAINLEWIQRINHDRRNHNQSAEQVTVNILEQLQDYIHFIVPQFSIADINFQRMPVVDTSNPFDLQPVPTEKESIVVVSFKDPSKYDVDNYLNRIDGSFLSRRRSLVIPGGQMQHALDIICAPLIEALINSNK